MCRGGLTTVPQETGLMKKTQGPAHQSVHAQQGTPKKFIHGPSLEAHDEDLADEAVDRKPAPCELFSDVGEFKIKLAHEGAVRIPIFPHPTGWGC